MQIRHFDVFAWREQLSITLELAKVFIDKYFVIIIQIVPPSHFCLLLVSHVGKIESLLLWQRGFTSVSIVIELSLRTHTIRRCIPDTRPTLNFDSLVDIHRLKIDFKYISELLVEQPVVFNPCKEAEVRNHKDSTYQERSVLVDV